ncbi:MAG: helix-turn-helix transcriptional regulator [Deltaproteobacteria bacterium]|nr:helix-turn-helix transcriptional regulator [Deltaproteobacteria bacterium]
MLETPYSEFLGATAGRFTIVGTSFVWCASPTLCGAVLWGEQSVAETDAILRIFDEYPRQMADRFAIVLDTRGVDRVDPIALARLFAWVVGKREDLAKHLVLQANVIREGPIGFLLTGLLPVAKWTLPYRLHHEPLQAFREVAGEEGVPLCAEVETISARLRDEPGALRRLRELLTTRQDVGVNEVSRALATSPRSLQRLLTRHGTSFHAELVAARLGRAKTLLRTTDDKLSAVASAIGVSERALTLLFRQHTDATPAEWRRRHRS